MLDLELIKRKVSLIQDELKQLTEFEDLTFEKMTHDYRTQAMIERFLERTITRAIDINQHIIAEVGKHLQAVRTYRNTFIRLSDLDVYSGEFAQRIAPSAGLRNALVHDYNNLDTEILQKSIGQTIKEFNEYTKYILAFVEKQER